MTLSNVKWLLICLLVAVVFSARAEITIVVPKKASEIENIAALEIRRYMYLRMGKTVPIPTEDMPPSGDIIAIAQKDHSILKELCDDTLKTSIAALEPEQYIAKTFQWKEGRKVLVIAGGDSVGALYGTYRVCEKIGVRFYLHGDVIPEQKIPLAIPQIDETGKPLFNIRGINPFHDFPEGPDWWNQDDYKSYISQLAKMRMNFIGLHCYPEGAGPEPAVWIGLKEYLDKKNSPLFSYPSHWANTKRDGGWGYAAMKTGDFAGGAYLIFAGDDYGPYIMQGMMPKPATPEENNKLFEKAGKMFKQAFGYAKKFGVKTCVGTETPLHIPKDMKEKLKADGKDISDQAVVKDVYEGMFTRIQKVYPVDYYWLWTPEGWTWGGNKPEQYEATVKDINAALEALAALGNPFTLATCGWVLGPQHDRTALDSVLPKAVPMSCISRQVGHAAVEAGFANIQGRPKWSIPWMENDPNLIAPQPWVGRMRYDAADSLRLGCTGLIGIHWRTKAMAHNVYALASSAWDQSWIPADFDKAPVSPQKPEEKGPAAGAIGGTVTSFSAPVDDTEDDAVYQSVRYNANGYNLEIPNGKYAVTLKFNEPHYTETGKRVFGAKIQGNQVLDKLDMFAKAGKNKALDFTYPDIAVTNGVLAIDFVREVENPCIAGITIQGMTTPANQVASVPYTRKINCGGKVYKEYEADEKNTPPVDIKKHRAMPCEDFYIDFARASFGDSVAESAGKLLAGKDGTNLVETTTWVRGPGGIKINKTPWSEEKTKYAFVEEFAALRAQVTGVTNLERFDYWLNTYRCMAVMGEIGCMRGDLDKTVVAIKAETDAGRKKELATKALLLRIEMAKQWEKMVSLQVAAVDTPGELGTIDNIERHNRLHEQFLSKHDKDLSDAIGDKLPDSVLPGKTYYGPARIIVPTVRTHIAEGEGITFNLILLDKQPMKGAALFYRVMGKGEYMKFDLEHLGRAVYQAKLLPAMEDFEYYIEAEKADGAKMFWPVTAPAIGQTVIVWGQMISQR